jgi:hypothetical protein
MNAGGISFGLPECREAEKRWAKETGLPMEPTIGGFIIG